MFLEVSRLTYHSPITIEALTYRVLLGNPLRQLSEVPRVQSYAGRRVGLSRLAPARLVEDELTDLDRLGVFRGPTWRPFPLMEIQRAPRSIR